MKSNTMILVGILLLTSIFLSACSTKTPEVTVSENTPIQIDPADQACQKDDDCVRAMVECSCDCGVPVNKNSWQKYLDMKENKCKNYSGAVCSMMCIGELKCVNNICTLNYDQKFK